MIAHGDASAGSEVLAVVGGGFVALWRGHAVKAPDGRAHHFATERDARDLMRLCDAVDSIPAIAVERPKP
jgi:hypothetical protein